MKIVVIAETHVGEHRVALVPDIASKLVASGFEVFVEADAGEEAGFTDDAYCEAGEVVEVDGVWIDGTSNIPSTVALHASQLYARNITNLLQYLGGEGKLKLDFDDEITKGCCVTHAGQVVNERARQMMEAAAAHQVLEKEVSR